MNIKLAKIFRDLMAFGKVETPEGVLIYEGDVLAEGTEVFIEDENGNIIPAPDGSYGEYEVKDGKIAPKEEEKPADEEKPAEEEVKEEETPAEEEKPAETEPEKKEDEEDKYEARIKALEDEVASLKSLLDELVKKEEEAFSSLKPAEKEIKDVQTGKGKGALKYFE